MQLKKYGLNLISVTALGIGSVVGAGIFALLGQVIMMAGDQTYYAFIIAGVAALFRGILIPGWPPHIQIPED